MKTFKNKINHQWSFTVASQPTGRLSAPIAINSDLYYETGETGETGETKP